MRKLVAAMAASAMLVAAPAPALAQMEGEKSARMDEFAGMMANLFETEPLTEEEQARLPLASSVVLKVMPDGTYARMMEESMTGMMEPLMSMMPATMPAGEMEATLGLHAGSLDDYSEEELAELSALLDPVYPQRGRAAMDFMMSRMNSAMQEMEPGMREGLARAYAKRFSRQELQDVAAFFATPSGAHYATESMLVFADPEVMAGAMQAMPLILGEMGDLEQGAKQAMAQLPPPRSFADLAAEERTRLAGLLGISEAELERRMAAGEAHEPAQEMAQ